jgi:hypothetical protein
LLGTPPTEPRRLFTVVIIPPRAAEAKRRTDRIPRASERRPFSSNSLNLARHSTTDRPLARELSAALTSNVDGREVSVAEAAKTTRRRSSTQVPEHTQFSHETNALYGAGYSFVHLCELSLDGTKRFGPNGGRALGGTRRCGPPPTSDKIRRVSRLPRPNEREASPDW